MWYVDDNKASHVDSKVIYNLLEIIKIHFGEITIIKGKKHTFLGMNIKMTENNEIEIEMEEQLMKIIDTFGEELD